MCKKLTLTWILFLLLVGFAGAQTAEGGDVGDAPDSSNHADAQIEAYPGVPGNFPTVYDPANGAPSGPMHWEAKVDSWLGAGVSVEADADKMPDEDGVTNIDPSVPVADRDEADDGKAKLTPLTNGQTAELTVKVHINTPIDERFVNVWFDWNRDGDWEDTFPAGSFAVPEWAVQNFVVSKQPGDYDVTLPSFLVHNPTPEQPLWMRVTLSKLQPPLNP